ncbi:MAG: N-acetyl-gamma-glutamyl-phosphate reductase [Polyangiales bacterium]
MTERVRVGVVGATGYTGAELLRLLLGHPHAEIQAVVGHSKAGEPVSSVLPSFRGRLDGKVEAFDAASLAERTDVCFLALPHGASAQTARALRAEGVVVMDLSADFRLRDPATYKTWYGEHAAPELLASAVYGLVELAREDLRTADLVAVAGCYPTASTLAAAPLLHAKLADPQSIIIDAKSGVSGAGRSPSPSTQFSETAEGLRAYKTGGTHRHVPEIEQTLSAVASETVRVTFTPHLVPMTRGILATVYATPARSGVTAEEATAAASKLYAGSPSVTVLDPGTNPDTAWVRGSNRAFVSYGVDARTGRIVGQSVIDNLVKGAAGQAIQCMNVRFGFDEGAGLGAVAVWP